MVGELIERIRKDDRRAMNQLYQLYVKELSSVCYRYVPNKSDAKDVLQNSFVKIFTTIPTINYHDEPSLKAWMKRVVVNEALCFLRERKKLLFVRLDEEKYLLSDDEEPQSESLSPDELHRLICELPDRYRTVVNLYIFESYSHHQIAEMLNIKETTSASQLHHAKQVLARRIKELMNEKQ